MKNLIITITLNLALILAGVFYLKNSVPKIGFVNIEKVYEDFNYKKEMESKLQRSDRIRQILLDSLKQELQSMSGDIQSGVSNDNRSLEIYKIRYENYARQEQKMKEESELEAQGYKNQIWKQINQYVKDYSNQYGYDFIYGKDESYSFLYAKESFDLTENVKEFINNKFKGKK